MQPSVTSFVNVVIECDTADNRSYLGQAVERPHWDERTDALTINGNTGPHVVSVSYARMSDTNPHKMYKMSDTKLYNPTAGLLDWWGRRVN